MLSIRVFGIFICVIVSCQLLHSVKAENERNWNSFHSILVNKERSLERKTRELSLEDVTKFKSLLNRLLRERKPKPHSVEEEKVWIPNGYKTGEKLKYEDLVRMVDHHGGKTFREADTENPRTSQTAEALLEEDTHDVHRKPIQTADNGRRSFLKGESLLWTNGIIPFKINKNVDDACREEISRAIAVFNDNTCLKWEPYSGSGKDHVEFFTGGISSSYVGNIQVSKYGHLYEPKLTNQPINIDSRHCTLHVVLHEMGHTVGMTHEQSRSDRDQYVTVQWEHVLEGEDNQNLAKEDTENHNIPYDYSSLMHYSVYAFSKDGEKTLEYTNTDYEFLGLRENTLSFYDIEDITKAYNCTWKCAGKECQNAGYLDHTCSCRCPKYLEGPTCDKVKTENCGGIITLQDQNDQQSIVSPNYPQSYSAGQNCIWLVKAPKGHGIELSSPDFDLPDNSLKRCNHWLEVRFNLIGQPGPLYCGDSLPVIETSSGGESHLLLLKFDSTNQFVDSGKGFHLNVRIKAQFNHSNGLVTDTSDDSVFVDDVINHCEVDPDWCYNEGTCVFRNGEVSCLCSDGYSGDFCEHSDNSKEATDKSTQYLAVLGTYSCHPSTACSIINLYSGFTWRMEEQGLVVSPQTGPKGSQAGFSIPFKVTENRDMCLEIHFRRLRAGTPCGVLEVTKHVEGADFGYGGYQYDLSLYRGGCGEGGKTVSSPISSFVGETTSVSLKVSLKEDGEFNIAIENISIIDGYC